LSPKKKDEPNPIDVIDLGENRPEFIKNPFFIEIGTADFDTYEGLAKQGYHGIFVEPVKQLLDNLERFEGCIYENNAITAEPRHCKVKYYDPEWAEGWVRGVGNLDMDMNHFHSNPQWKEYEREQYLHTITLDQLIDKHNVERIDMLKIDTEGTEYEILDSYSWKIKPKFMKIEYQHWVSRGVSVEKYIKMLESMGYKCKKDKNDFVAVL
tara:strand:+ start:89 stop:718 length:630 start_codon:yes stop_codon:yes gene_type:complete